jgi:hypothetical protein
MATGIQDTEYDISVKTTEGGVQVSDVNKQGVASRFYEHFTGYDIPNFHRLVRKGVLLPQTPWESFGFSWRGYGTVNYYFQNTTDPQMLENHRYSDGVFPGNGNLPYTYDVALDDISEFVPSKATLNGLAQEAAAKMYTSGYDVLTSVAELTETTKMFKHLGKKLLELKLPKNVFKFKRLKDLSNVWLEARYGWRTFLYDLRNLQELIDTYNDKTRSRNSERVFQKSEDTWTEVEESANGYFYFESKRVVKRSISLTGSVIADITIPKLQANPILTAWELVPLSFVVDWFVSVGKALAAASFLTFQTDYSASGGYKIELDVHWSRKPVNYPVTGSVTQVYGGTDEQYFDLEINLERRHPCNVPLTPHLTLNLNTLKILDLVGLVIQRLRR